MGWEQSEEVGRRLLEDMKRAEAAERVAAAELRALGKDVASRHAAGLPVERDWSAEEEVYARLNTEMAALARKGHSSDNLVVLNERALAVMKRLQAPLPPGASPVLPRLVPNEAPIQRTRGLQAELDHPAWEQEQEVYQRLAHEIADLEARGVSSVPGLSAPGVKWIPVGPKPKPGEEPAPPSTAETCPPWEQDTEVYARLVAELVVLESRADARVAAVAAGEPEPTTPGGSQLPSLEHDQLVYNRVSAQLAVMEDSKVVPKTAPLVRRSNSRGVLLPEELPGAAAPAL